MKLLHTADWQIGMKAAQLGPAAARARAARLDTARRIATLARREQVDLAVLAGDAFENHAVALSDVEEITHILAGFPCPVVVLPGNHDPLTPEGVWDLPVWRACPNVHIARLESPLEFESCVVFPCPLRSHWGAGDPTAWIPSGQFDNCIRIGVAHGAVAGLPNQENTRWFAADAPSQRRLDYLALGDWHSTRLYPGPDGAVRMAYSGTPEPTSFGEDDSGNVLLVEIGARGAAPRIQPERVARLEWRSLSFDVAQPGDLARVRARVGQLAGENAVVEVRLSGTLFPEDGQELEELRRQAAEFLYLRIKEDLRPMLWLEDLPAGPLQEAARRLEAEAQAGNEPEAARQALRTLLALARGAAQ